MQLGAHKDWDEMHMKNNLYAKKVGVFAEEKYNFTS